MANLQKVKYMIAVLRSRIGEPVEDKFTDLELMAELSLAQFDVASRLSGINKKWLTKESTVSLERGTKYGSGTLPSDCQKIESITTKDYEPIREIPESDVSLLSSSVYEQSGNNIQYRQVGTELRIYSGTYSIGEVYVNHIIKPSELTDYDDETAIPVEFVDLIIAHTEWKCAPKAGLNETQKKSVLDKMYSDLEKENKT